MVTLLLQQGRLSEEHTLGISSFWPTTAVGWISGVIALLSLVALVYGYMKALTVINGLGGRVANVEGALATITGQNIERDKAYALLVQAQTDLTRQIGEAKKAAEQCDSSSEQYFMQIGHDIKMLGDKIEHEGKDQHGRMVAIETELKLRNQALPLHLEKR